MRQTRNAEPTRETGIAETIPIHAAPCLFSQPLRLFNRTPIDPDLWRRSALLMDDGGLRAEVRPDLSSSSALRVQIGIRCAG